MSVFTLEIRRMCVAHMLNDLYQKNEVRRHEMTRTQDDLGVEGTLG